MNPFEELVHRSISVMYYPTHSLLNVGKRRALGDWLHGWCIICQLVCQLLPGLVARCVFYLNQNYSSNACHQANKAYLFQSRLRNLIHLSDFH